jgi:hypothetical protein
MLRCTKISSKNFRITSPLRACPDFSSGGNRDGVVSTTKQDRPQSIYATKQVFKNSEGHLR